MDVAFYVLLLVTFITAVALAHFCTFPLISDSIRDYKHPYPSKQHRIRMSSFLRLIIFNLVPHHTVLVYVWRFLHQKLYEEERRKKYPK